MILSFYRKNFKWRFANRFHNVVQFISVIKMEEGDKRVKIWTVLVLL